MNAEDFFSQVRLNRNRVAKQFQLSMVGHIITKFVNRCSIPFWKKTKKIILNPKSKSTIAQSADNKFGSRWVVWLSNRPFFPQKKSLLVAFSFFFSGLINEMERVHSPTFLRKPLFSKMCKFLRLFRSKFAGSPSDVKSPKSLTLLACYLDIKSLTGEPDLTSYSDPTSVLNEKTWRIYLP